MAQIRKLEPLSTVAGVRERRHLNFLGWFLSLVPVLAMSAEYGVESGVEAGYEYNDNVRLLPENAIDISGTRVAIPASLSAKTERLEASLEGELVFSRFNREEYDSDDQNLTGRANYLFENGAFSSYAGMVRDSTRDSEFLDTGAVGLTAVRREKILAGLSGKHMFTKRSGVSAAFDFSDVNYESDRYQPYRYGTGTLGYLWQYSEHTEYRLEAYGSHFDSEGFLDTRSEGVGGQVGLQTQISEPLELTLTSGWVEIETEYRDVPVSELEDSEDGQLLLDALLEYKLPRSRLRLGASFLPRPSANGTLQTTEQVDLDYRYDITERSRIDFRLTAGQRKPLDEQFNGDRDYARAQIRYGYRLFESWFLTADYTYSYQDREQDDGDADANAIVFGVKFQPQKHSWSR